MDGRENHKTFYFPLLFEWLFVQTLCYNKAVKFLSWSETDHADKPDLTKTIAVTSRVVEDHKKISLKPVAIDRIRMRRTGPCAQHWFKHMLTREHLIRFKVFKATKEPAKDFGHIFILNLASPLIVFYGSFIF